MKTILLVYPKTGWYTEFFEKTLPLSLLNISVFLKDYKVIIVDQRFGGWKKKILHVLKQNPLCVGITSIIGKQIINALAIAGFVKSHSDIPIIFGGPLPTTLPKETLDNKFIDIIIKGEGEITFFELIKTLDAIKNKKQKTKFNKTKGIWYKESGKIIRNRDGPFINLDLLPQLPYNLLNINRYLGKQKTLPIETSRGCSHSCAFCITNQWRALNAEKSFQNIKNLYEKFDVRKIWVVDDNFFNNLKRARTILSLSKQLDIKFDIPGTTFTSLNAMDFDYLNLLDLKVGQLYLGVESGSPKILKSIKKNIDIPQLIRLNKKLSNYKFKIFYNFMFGFPGESHYDRKLTFSLIDKLLKENANARISPIYSFTSYPGSSLYNPMAVSRKIEDWSEFDWKNTTFDNKIKNLYFKSLFIDNKIIDRFPNLKFIQNIYKPILKYQLRTL